jgi:hypothetical protein
VPQEHEQSSPAGCTLHPLKTRAHPPHTSHIICTEYEYHKEYLSESPKAIDSDNDDDDEHVSSLTFRYSKKGPLIN